jgi:hypothetical protein
VAPVPEPVVSPLDPEPTVVVPLAPDVEPLPVWLVPVVRGGVAGPSCSDTPLQATINEHNDALERMEYFIAPPVAPGR